MLAISSIILLAAFSFGENQAAIVTFSENFVVTQFNNFDSRISSTWGEHANDFVELIDVGKVISIFMGYVDDPEVLNFLTFVISSEFKEIVWEFESLAEFKEAFLFLTEKGYDVETAINFMNTALDLPPFEYDKLDAPKTLIPRGAGMTGLIEDVIATLPIKEIKKLFESKLETSPEIAELFATINSPEFMEIMKKMSKNPKFIEIKETFAGYGFDFKYLCSMAKEVFGKYYQGVFCEI